jgi:hypothetical protein
VSKKRRFQGQIIYATSQDKKDVDCVIAISLLKKYPAHAVVPDLGLNHVTKEYGIDCDVPWNLQLGVIIYGTWI